MDKNKGETTLMSAEEITLAQVKQEILAAITETNEALDLLKDELSDAIEEINKGLSAQIAEAAAYQQKVLEPNQRTINDNILKVYAVAKKTPQEEPEEWP